MISFSNLFFSCLALLFAAVVLLLVLLKKNSRLNAEKNDLLAKSGQTLFQQEQLEELKKENSRLNDENGRLKEKAAVLETQMKEESRHLNDKIEELKKAREELSVQFKAVSADLLKTQTADFKKDQQESLGQILTPLKDQLDAFKKRMEDIHQTNLVDKGEMNKQLEKLFGMNQSLSEDAKNLTNALKGNTKHQGDWGETQLERVFEVAGFEKGINYSTQENFKDEDGNNKRPDYIVNLPNNRRLIVDCKVSLNAYMRYIKAETPEDKKKSLGEHVQALRNHIKELASKNYQSEIKEQGLDYVFMFIPVEQAYIEALSADPEIYEAAYQNNIAVTTASSLLPVLRTIENLWRIEKQNRNVQQIAEIGGKLHDKLVGFVEDMQAIDKALTKAKSSYDDAFKKLSEGKGNAIGWAEKLKLQGARVTKEFQVDFDDQDLPQIEGN
ncbi:MAG: DNA recombination protein RmuC [Alphaproteobacteria bacterium]|nr:DNA recombination protein RmuC [Alphaproteobacteria bacterium]MBO4644744.1 DNA recombination protein RmuC [Alphaproteobacteria bacterium]